MDLSLPRIIDVHCHYPMFNTEIKTLEEVDLNRLTKIAFKYYCKSLNVKWSDDLAELSANFKKRFFDIIDTCSFDHLVVLAFDAIYDEAGLPVARKSILRVSNDCAREICEENTKLIFGASINPQRRDAFEELERVYNMDAALIKMHPTLQLFNPRDPKYFKFYQKIAQLRIPVLMHIGKEAAVPGMKMSLEYQKIENVIPLLEAGCTVIAAHGMGASQVFERYHFNRVEKLLKKYKNLYLDNSAMSQFHRKSRAHSIINSKIALSRTLFGTDFPIKPQLPAFITDIHPKKTAAIALNTKNILDRDMEIKYAIGFPVESFSRGYELISERALNKLEFEQLEGEEKVSIEFAV